MPEDVTTSSSNPIEETTEPIVICAFSQCTEQNVKRCRKCNRPFCILHCNHFSPNFCKECFSNLGIVAEKFKRSFDYIGNNGQLYTQTETRIKYYLDGIDWPFIMPWIDSLNDEELGILWVFHHYIMRMIEVENDTRRVQHTRQLQNTPVPKLITQTVSKKVTKINQPETPEQLKAKWLKQGLSAAVVDMMVAALEKK